MPRLSRRQFLKFAGIACAGSWLPALSIWPDHVSVYGRTLGAAPVYTRPDPNAAIVRHLWPDSVLPLTEAHDTWYRVDDGYIQRTMAQPMTLDMPQTETPPLPFWAEVSAPVAPIWQWCAVDAPLVTRIGHGGAVRVIDHLPGWYGIADEHDALLGWSQIANWTAVQPISTTMPLQIVIDGSHMTIYRSNQRVAAAPVSFGQTIPPGTYSLEKGLPGGLRCCLSPEDDYHGASWQFRFGGEFDLTSVYWHNRFGQPVPGPAVQITPVLGRWLYRAADNGGIVSIISQS